MTTNETNTAASVPVDELILQAVARGWCAPENAKKVVDPDLAVAITREVQAALATQPAPDTRRAPVQKYHDKTIPWRVHGLAWEAYAKEYGTSQSAERLAERGGFGIGEMDRFLPGWRDMAHAIDFPAQPAPVVGDIPEELQLAWNAIDDVSYGPLNKYAKDVIARYLTPGMKGHSRIVGSRRIDGVHVIVAKPASDLLPEQLLVRHEDYLALLAARPGGEVSNG